MAETAAATYRVIVAKPGLDGHDRGARVIARALRDAGFEVIYTGLHQTPEMVVSACVQEDADVLCLSILSGAHMTLIPVVLERLREAGLETTPVIAGGIIPAEDAASLRKHGVREVMGPGTTTEQVIELTRRLAAERRAALEAD
ncbi:MAG TPA: cobalamin B12-binding domain-containing protein [Firmicutes bacterium]|nr:cobalamin B12-binding domain-containing protein [Bacillota bacterium]